MKMKILFDKYPLDIILCILCSLILIPIVLLDLNDTVRTVLGLIVILFIPGYLLIFVLFPSKKTEEGINVIERITLSFGTSMAIVGLIGFAILIISGKIELEYALLSIFIFEISMGVASLYRWFITSPDERIVVSINVSLTKIKDGFKFNGKLDKLLIVVLITLMLITVTLFIFVITKPRTGGEFTGFYLFGSDRSITNLPNNINSGENVTIIIGVTNHEYQTISYTIEVWLINQTITFNKSTNKYMITYNNAWFMDKINITLDHTDINSEEKWKPQWQYDYTFNITKKGQNLTLVFLLFTNHTKSYDYNKDYKDEIEQKILNAYEKLYLWINVN